MTSLTKPGQKWRWSLPAIVLLTLSVLAVKVFGPKPTYSDHAENLVLGLMSGDVSGLEELVPKRELEAYKWSKADAREFLRDFVAIRLRGFRKQRVLEKESVNSGFAGIYTAEVTDGRRPLNLSQMVKATPDGPKSSIRSLLMMVWTAEAQLEADPKDRKAMFGSLLRSVRRDRASLEQRGMLGLMTLDTESKLKTWNEIEEGLLRESG